MFCVLFFAGCFFCVYFFDYFHINFRVPAVKCEKSVYLLFNIGKLSIAKTKYFGIVKQRVGKSAVSVVKFFNRKSGFAVAPGFCSVLIVAFFVFKPDSSVLGHKYWFAFVRLSCGVTVEKYVFSYELIIICFKNIGILFVIVNVKNICHNVIVSACVNARTGGVSELGLLVYDP